MKKILLGIGLILCGFGAQAQELSRPISFGPRIGGNMSNIWNEQEDNTSSVFGANAGVVSNIRFTKKYAIQVEALYSGKGFIQTGPNIKNTLHYIEVPALFQRSFFSNKKGGHLAEKRRRGNIFIVAGPQLSILMNSTVEFRNYEGSENLNVYVNTRPFDMGAVLGVGYQMKNGFVIDARYALGMRHLHAGNRTAYIPGDITNTAFQLGVSYLIPIRFR